jgi:hypothetical protein
MLGGSKEGCKTKTTFCIKEDKSSLLAPLRKVHHL